jgi:ABC-type branched-subunit amino acid transport system substrate-binding protein
MKLKSSGAETVIMWVNPTHAAITMKTAAAMKYQPQWVTSSTLSDAPLMSKITGGLWGNVIFAGMIEDPDSTSPYMTKYREAFKKYAQKGERWGVFFLAGIGFVEPMIQGFKKAGPNLTRESFVAGMESIKNFKGIMGNVSFDAKKRQGCSEVYVAKTDKTGMKTIRLTDWMSVR